MGKYGLGGVCVEARSTPWARVLLAAVASVGWAFLAMAGTAALGLHLLGADTAGSLGPMTAAVVAMAVGGKVKPAGDIGAFGISGSQAQGAIGIAPLGVAVVGAVLLAWIFLRFLRGAGALVSPAELAARFATTAVLFVAVLGGLAWAGQDTIAIDSGSIGPPRGATDDLLGSLPGIGKISGGLADGLQGIIKSKTSVKFHVDTGPTLVGGVIWVLVVLLIALVASRRTPLPAGWSWMHRTVRPAGSALVVVLLVAVLAGFSAAVYAALTGDEPGRIMGAALLGTPNGVWLAVPLGLFVPWKGTATGPLATLLPDPVDRLLAGGQGATITPARLADFNERVWLLPVAVALMMLVAGTLTAARTPLGGSRAGYVGRCALRLAVVTAVALPLLVSLTKVKVNANLSLFGFDAVGAGIDLRGSVPLAILLGAAWGAGAAFVGALLALATGAAGQQVAAPAQPGVPGQAGQPPAAASGRPAAVSSDRTYPEVAYRPGPYLPSPGYRPEEEGPNPYVEPDDGPPRTSPRESPRVSDAQTIAAPPPPRRPSGPPEEKWPPPPPPPPASGPH